MPARRHAPPTPTACRAAMCATIVLGMGKLGIRVQCAKQGSSRKLVVMLRAETVFWDLMYIKSN